MNREGCGHRLEGGGRDLSVVLVVLMMLALPFLIGESDCDITGEYTGSGTADDPFDGRIGFGSLDDAGQKSNLWGYYFTVGSELFYDSKEFASYPGTYTVEESLGLVWSDTKLVPTGTIEYAGTFRVVYQYDVTDEYVVYEFYAVGPYPTLTFKSDPADGILIPPNHHLLTFNYLDGTTVYRVVEHGGFLEDVPATENWWLAKDYGNADSQIPITSDLVFNEEHSGGAVG